MSNNMSNNKLREKYFAYIVIYRTSSHNLNSANLKTSIPEM